MVIECPFCGAQSTEVLPHGEGQPCPLQAAILTAQANLLEQQAEATKATATKVSRR